MPAKKAPIYKSCVKCGKEYTQPSGRQEISKYCSRACSDQRERPKNMVRCRECGAQMAAKPSHVAKKVWGTFCSPGCTSAYKSRVTVGSGNSNFRGRNFDSDGYRVYAPAASLKLGLGQIKLHHAVAFVCTGLRSIPPGMHVHHKDCNVLNNTARNLQFMTISDHQWLHKQFGTATLAAIERGDLEIAVAASWSDDALRATGLLMQDVLSQGAKLRHYKKKGIDLDIAEVATSRAIRCSLTVVKEFSDGRSVSPPMPDEELFAMADEQEAIFKQLDATTRGAGGFGSTGG